MTLVYILVVATFAITLGIFIGARLGPKRRYAGVIIIKETSKGLKYELQVNGDPELLTLMDEVTFKIIGPDYSIPDSRDKLGV